MLLSGPIVQTDVTRNVTRRDFAEQPERLNVTLGTPNVTLARIGSEVGPSHRLDGIPSVLHAR